MNDLIPGRTAWETRQYRTDHGHRVASAIGLKLLAEFLVGDDTIPVPPHGSTIYAPVSAGSPVERVAAVDRFAAAHHVATEWDSEHVHYGARVAFGPFSYFVYTNPALGADAPSGRAA